MEIVKFPKKVIHLVILRMTKSWMYTSRSLIAKKGNSGYGPLIEIDFE